MWTAKCSYLNQLYYPPSNYSNVMKELYSQTIFHPTLSQTKYKCLQPNHTSNNHLGTNRYSLERYPFSHPYVKPCDIIPASIKNLNLDNIEKWKPTKLQRGPTKSPDKIGLQYGIYKTSFARLYGRLFEWDYIYNLKPPNNSWVYKYYKGGYEHGSKHWMQKKGCTTTSNKS